VVKYSDNPDYEYEQIDLATMYDLRDARLVLAQIVSVDRANNCAEITIAESCEELAGKDLSAVPFFYHCEDSTGTLEDLARGNKAFKDDEYVYCLWAPTVAELDERLYIIGHADIRVTKTCALGEYIFLRTNGPAPYYVTIFDTSSGTTLNLEEFVNLDESSPPKPLTPFPCELTTEVVDWIAYNFRDSIVRDGIGGYVSFDDDRTGSGLTVITDDSLVPTYDGAYISNTRTEYHAYDSGSGYFEHTILNQGFTHKGSSPWWANNVNIATSEIRSPYWDVEISDTYGAGSFTATYQVERNYEVRFAGVGTVGTETVTYDGHTIGAGKDGVLNINNVSLSLLSNEGTVVLVQRNTRSVHMNNTDTAPLEQWGPILETFPDSPDVVAGELGVYYVAAKGIRGDIQEHYETEAFSRWSGDSSFRSEYVEIAYPVANSDDQLLYVPTPLASLYIDVIPDLDVEGDPLPITVVTCFEQLDVDLTVGLATTMQELDDFVVSEIGSMDAGRPTIDRAVAYMKKKPEDVTP